MTEQIILVGDVREQLDTLKDQSVQCCVTSPPYYGLRDYGTAQWDGGDPACDHQYFRGGNGEASAKQVTSAGTQKYNYPNECKKCGAVRVDRQIGLEPTLAEYIATMVDVFRGVRRVLRDDGTLWLNIGDSYAGSGPSSSNQSGMVGVGDKRLHEQISSTRGVKESQCGMKAKDLMMVPARLAIALQDDGWYLRSDIIWAKPNPMPESVRDRPTSAHEHIFLLTKQARYFYDADAVAEPSTGVIEPTELSGVYSSGAGRNDAATHFVGGFVTGETRNLRNVWPITTKPFPGAHFATFPPEIPRRCIKAGSREGDTILDPFLGSGTTLAEAQMLGRNGIGIELNREYAEIARRRIGSAAPLFGSVEVKE